MRSRRRCRGASAAGRHERCRPQDAMNSQTLFFLIAFSALAQLITLIGSVREIIRLLRAL